MTDTAKPTEAGSVDELIDATLLQFVKHQVVVNAIREALATAGLVVVPKEAIDNVIVRMRSWQAASRAQGELHHGPLYGPLCLWVEAVEKLDAAMLSAAEAGE